MTLGGISPSLSLSLPLTPSLPTFHPQLHLHVMTLRQRGVRQGRARLLRSLRTPRSFSLMYWHCMS